MKFNVIAYIYIICIIISSFTKYCGTVLRDHPMVPKKRSLKTGGLSLEVHL